MRLFGTMASTLFPITANEPRTAGSDGLPRLADGQEPARLRLLLLTVGLGVGGTEGQIAALALRLDRRQYDVTVCALKGDGVIARELREQEVRVVTLNGRGPWDLRVLIRLANLVRRERPQIVHAFLFRANVAARLVGRLLQVPVLISSYRCLGTRMCWSHRVLDRLTIRWSHVSTCCSEAVRQATEARLGSNPDRFVTIHNGVEPAWCSGAQTMTKRDLGLDEDLPVIAMIGRLVEPEKGLAVLLQAMGHLKTESARPPCQLLIVGEGPSSDSLRALAKELGVASWVTFAGLRRDVAGLLPCLEVFVMPSLSEGFGVTIVEAMMAGRPVVATAVGGIPEIVRSGETGLLVPPGDPAALAAAIRTMLEHPEWAAELGAQGRRRAEAELTLEAMAAKHHALYQLLVARRRVENIVTTSQPVREAEP